MIYACSCACYAICGKDRSYGGCSANSAPSLDDGDEQCHLHLQLPVVYSSLLSEVCIHVRTYPRYM